MRQIKFRAWFDSKMWEVVQMGFNPNGSSSVTLYCNGELLFKDDDTDVVFMQYTGLKDKNGREIYEGDILTWGNNVIAKVYYADDLAVFRCVIEGTEEFDLFTFNQEASIIGNIYENKELLDE